MAVEEIQSPPACAFSKNPIPIILQTDLSANPFIYIQISAFGKTITSKKRPDSNNQVIWDIAEILDPEFKDFHDFPVLDYDMGTFPRKCENIIQPYSISYWDVNDDSEPPTPISIGPFKVLKGGIEFVQYPHRNDFFDLEITNNILYRWLTWKPQGTLLQSNDIEFLYFITLPGVSNKPDIYFSWILNDNSTGGVNLFSMDNVAEYEVYYFPVGPILVGLQNQIDVTTLKSLSITVQAGEVESLPSRTYKCNTKYFHQRRQYLFENSLGGVDTAYFIGNAKPGIDNEQTVLDKNVPHDYNMPEGQRKVYDVLEQYAVKSFSGPLTKVEANWLRDFFVSAYKAEIVDYRFIEIVFKKLKLELPEDESIRGFVEIEYEYAHKNKVYTPPNTYLNPIVPVE